MRLLPLSILIALLVLGIGISSEYLSRYYLVIPKLQELEAKTDRKEFERTLLAIQTIRDKLSLLVQSEGYWTQLYDITRQKKFETGFIKETYNVDTFLYQSFDVLFIITHNKDYVLIELDNKTGELAKQPLLNPDELKTLIPAHKPLANAPELYSDYAFTSRGPMMYSVGSIHNSDITSKSSGYILFGSYLREEVANDISILTKVKTQFLNHKKEKIDYQKNYRNEKNELMGTLENNNGIPITTIKIELPPHDIEPRLQDSNVIAFEIMATLILFILFIIYYKLIIPVSRITNHLANIRASGNYDRQLNSNSKNEIGILSRECDLLVKNIAEQQEKLIHQAEFMEKLSLIDGLTGIANRRAFDEAFSRELAHSKRFNHAIALMVCDVDLFKLYNDTYGHAAGDQVLKKIAGAIKSSCKRASDFVARYGGEEFVVLLQEVDAAQATIVAEQIKQAVFELEISHAHSQHNQRVTLSIGLFITNNLEKITAEEIFSLADEALYIAKKHGRNRLEVINKCN